MGKHVPTPWVAIDDLIYPADVPDEQRWIADLRGAFKQASNAEFIVRAVNSHAELVALAEAVVKHFGYTNAPLAEQAETILAKVRP